MDELFPLQRIDPNIGFGGSRVDVVTCEMMVISPPVLLKYTIDKFGAEKFRARFFIVGDTHLGGAKM